MKKVNTMVISCGVQGCCPTVEVKGDDVAVKDDFGNVARMNKAQLVNLAQQILKKI